MGDHTAISWSDATWNPTTGCTKVSAGCDHCYAERVAPRQRGNYAYDGVVDDNGWTGHVNLIPSRLDQPLRWRQPRLIFVDSMSDLFHPAVPDEFIRRVFAVMTRADWHHFQILTKRPQRMARLLADGAFWYGIAEESPSNIWLGTSIETDRYVFRADHVRVTPAAVRFLSLEPLLGPLPSLDLADIDWVIVGGESGPHHRPMDLDWARDLRDRCVAADIPFHFKQIGGRTAQAGGRLLDGRTWDELPRHLEGAHA